MVLDFLHTIADLDAIDLHFGVFLAELACKENPSANIAVAAALTHHAVSLGDICCDLHAYANTSLMNENGQTVFVGPDYPSWMAELQQSLVVGSANQARPLVMDAQGYLYLYQYFMYQKNIQDFILKSSTIALNKNFAIAEIIKRLFNRHQPELDFNDPLQRQILAGLNCAVNPFCVISGGPGTGKTTTIARILALLLELKLIRPGRILLAAPTGKAAARLSEAVSKAKSELATAPAVLKGIPEEAFTIHRLLALIPRIDVPRALHAQLRLPADLVLVDEASMADIELLNRLLEVLPPTCRLILVGDHAQLASVGAGSVLTDICGDITQDTSFSPDYAKVLQTVFGGNYQAIAQLPSQIELSQPQDSLVFLTKNYRFAAGEKGLSELSSAIRHGSATKALEQLKDKTQTAVQLLDNITPNRIIKSLSASINKYYEPVFGATTPAAALDCFEKFRILCAVKEGPFGAQNLNRACEYRLQQLGYLDGSEAFYHGKPIIISKNDYRLRLFNGDIGIIWREKSGTGLRVYFRDYQQEKLRAFNCYSLPQHETAYAMTVHRSQGSEFDHVLLVLPDRDNRILTRELVYTGISRAKQTVEIWSRADLLANAIQRVLERKSGLRRLLIASHTDTQ